MSELPSYSVAEDLSLRKYWKIQGRSLSTGDVASYVQRPLSGIETASLFTDRSHSRANLRFLPYRQLSLRLLPVLIAAILAGCTNNGDTPANARSSRYPVPRHISYSFTLVNQTEHVVQRAELWAFAPVSKTSTQRCDRIEASQPYEVLKDERGNQSLRFNIEIIPPYGSKIVRVHAHLSLSDTPNRMESGNSRDFLGPEAFIPSDGREIMALVQEITHQNAASRPEALFGWILRNIGSSGYARTERGALDRLKRRAGDGTEQAFLFAALCRAAQIPARVMGGYVCDGDCVLTAQAYHNWSEFYEDESWHLADPQGRVFAESSSRYIAMRVLGAAPEPNGSPMEGLQRFRVRGEGLTARMN